RKRGFGPASTPLGTRGSAKTGTKTGTKFSTRGGQRLRHPNPSSSHPNRLACLVLLRLRQQLCGPLLGLGVKTASSSSRRFSSSSSRKRSYLDQHILTPPPIQGAGASAAAHLITPDHSRIASRQTWRGLVLCGALAPVVFTTGWITGSLVQKGYSMGREDISALAALDAERPWIMIAGLTISGALTTAFAAGLRHRVRGARSAPALVALAGLGMIALAVFRNDCSSETEACKARVRT